MYDEDLIVLIEKHLEDATPHWQLVSLHTTAGVGVLPTATIAIRRPDGEIVQDAAIGDGPVDAIFKAVERVTGVRANLQEFVVRSVTQGKDARVRSRSSWRSRATTVRIEVEPPRPTSSRPRPWRTSTPSTRSPPARSAATSAKSSAGRGRGVTSRTGLTWHDVAWPKASPILLIALVGTP